MSLRPQAGLSGGQLAPVEEEGEFVVPPEFEIEANAGESEEPLNLRPLRAPEAPTVEEIEVHEAAGHPNFRSWCRACVAGAARDSQHRAQDKSEIAVPTLHADYGFMGEKDEVEEKDARCMPILVLKFDKDKFLHSHAVPAKV